MCGCHTYIYVNKGAKRVFVCVLMALVVLDALHVVTLSIRTHTLALAYMISVQSSSVAALNSVTMATCRVPKCHGSFVEKYITPTIA